MGYLLQRCFRNECNCVDCVLFATVGVQWRIYVAKHVQFAPCSSLQALQLAARAALPIGSASKGRVTDPCDTTRQAFRLRAGKAAFLEELKDANLDEMVPIIVKKIEEFQKRKKSKIILSLFL